LFGFIIDTFASINTLRVELKQIEKISRALADSTRLKILADMSKQHGTIQCSAIMNCTNLAQPSVSHHVKTLIEAGIIEAEKDGRNHSYKLNPTVLKAYSNWITEITGI